MSSPGDSDGSATLAPNAAGTQTMPDQPDEKEKTGDGSGSSLKPFLVSYYNLQFGICPDIDMAVISARLPLQ